MSEKKTIPADVLFARWREDPEYVAEYSELESEYAVAAAIIEARTYAGLTQGELAKRMGTTQSVIARLEGGKSKPSTSTLEKLAVATGTRLRISFEPQSAQTT
jgi:ribosome-binding protein aMBF1 (putative translation factor)